MGIKHLGSILKNLTTVHHHSSVKNFHDSEKNRLFAQYIRTNEIVNLIEQRKIRNYINHKPYVMAIDASMFLMRYKMIFKKLEYGILRQILSSLQSKIVPIYIFDGTATEQKRKTINQRKNKKQKIKEQLQEEIEKMNDFEKLIYHIKLLTHELDDLNKNSNFLRYDSDENSPIAKLTKKTINLTVDDIEEVKKFLDFLGIPHITANGEADDLIAYLYEKKIINACLSDDMDMLPKGCGNLIRIDRTGVTQFILDDILKELKLDHLEFIDLCILLGCDYYTIYLPRLKAIDLYNIFINFSSLEKFIKEYSQTDPEIINHLMHYQSVRKLFLEKMERYDQKISVPKKFFSLDAIKIYFKNLGINLGDDNYKKYKWQIQEINKVIHNWKKYYFRFS